FGARTRNIMAEVPLESCSADRKAVRLVTHALQDALALADGVVIMSAGPASRIIGDHRISLPRPRDLAEIRHTEAFSSIYRTVWQQLKQEVLAAYRMGDQQ